LGKKVIFITGTDEHGEKIATAATAQGSTPTDHCNLISQAYKTLWNDVIPLPPLLFYFQVVNRHYSHFVRFIDLVPQIYKIAI